jgi:hypothetical protein
MTTTAVPKNGQEPALPPPLDLEGLVPPLAGLTDSQYTQLGEAVTEGLLQGLSYDEAFRQAVNYEISGSQYAWGRDERTKWVLRDLLASVTADDYAHRRIFNAAEQSLIAFQRAGYDADHHAQSKFLAWYNQIWHPFTPSEEVSNNGNAFLGLIDGLGKLTGTDPLGHRAEDRQRTARRSRQKAAASLQHYHSRLVDVSTELRGEAVGNQILPYGDMESPADFSQEVPPSSGRTGSMTGNETHLLNGNGRKSKRNAPKRSAGRRTRPSTTTARSGSNGVSNLSAAERKSGGLIGAASGAVGSANTIRQGLSFSNANWNGISGLMLTGTLPMVNVTKVNTATTILQDADGTNQGWFTVDPTGAETDWLTSSVPRIASCFQRWKLMKFRFTYMPTAVTTTDSSRIIFACSSDPENPVIKNASSTYATLQTCERQMAGPIFSVMHMDLPIDMTSELKYIYEVAADSERLAHYGVLGGRISADPGSTIIFGCIYATFAIGFFEMNPQSSVLSREDRLRRIAERQSHETLRLQRAQKYREDLQAETKKRFLELVKESPIDPFYTTQCRVCGVEFSRTHGVLNDSSICDACVSAIRGIETKVIQVSESESTGLSSPPVLVRSATLSRAPSAMTGLLSDRKVRL